MQHQEASVDLSIRLRGSVELFWIGKRTNNCPTGSSKRNTCTDCLAGLDERSVDIGDRPDLATKLEGEAEGGEHEEALEAAELADLGQMLCELSVVGTAWLGVGVGVGVGVGLRVRVRG